MLFDVTVLGLVGGAPGGETPRVADSSAAGAGRFLTAYLLLRPETLAACKTLGIPASNIQVLRLHAAIRVL